MKEWQQVPQKSQKETERQTPVAAERTTLPAGSLMAILQGQTPVPALPMPLLQILSEQVGNHCLTALLEQSRLSAPALCPAAPLWPAPADPIPAGGIRTAAPPLFDGVSDAFNGWFGSIPPSNPGSLQEADGYAG